jgi:hypothetical protein
MSILKILLLKFFKNITNFIQTDTNAKKTKEYFFLVKGQGSLSRFSDRRLLSEALIWMRNDWQPTPCGMPDKRNDQIGKRRETPNDFQQILQDKYVLKACFILSS